MRILAMSLAAAGTACALPVSAAPASALIAAAAAAPVQGGRFGRTNGRNVALAQHSQGRFVETAPGRWGEFDASGREGFRFVETGRDEWSVYLFDQSRNVRIQIDIWRGQIRYADGNSPYSDLYVITNAAPRAGGGGGGPNWGGGDDSAYDDVRRVEYPGGFFQNVGGGRWVETARDGSRLNFNEVRGRQGTIRIYDQSRAVTIIFYFDRNTIFISDRGGPERFIYPISRVVRGGGGGGGYGGGRPNWGGGGGGGWNQPATRNVDAGPIWNQADAVRKCTDLARREGGEWTGQWRTTVVGRMSVCEIRFSGGGSWRR